MSDVLEKAEAEKCAIRHIQSIFGLDYLKKNREGSCTAKGYWPDRAESMFFVGIKDRTDLPNHPANSKGWTVYAEVWIDLESGKVKKQDYMME